MCVERARVRRSLACSDGGQGRMRSVERHKMGKRAVWEKETKRGRGV